MSVNAINTLNQDKVFESCTIEIKIDQTKFIVAGLYRTPSEKIDIFLEKLNTFLAEICKINKNVLIGGDINVDVLREGRKKTDFVSLINMHGFKYTIKIPTRITETCESAIDNFITNLDENSFEVECLITALSDHDAQLFKIVNINNKRGHNTKNTVMGRRYGKDKIDLFKDDLEKQDWTELYQSSVEDKFLYFYNLLKYYFDLHFSLTKITKGNQNKEWVDDEIVNEHDKLIDMYQQYRKDKNNINLKKKL
ncbi:hypothetical protein J6590_108710 [Homalodisca vitripennis]|nr:hypothetical protein J6590_108710 [Homalodisca vitripennis]